MLKKLFLMLALISATACPMQKKKNLFKQVPQEVIVQVLEFLCDSPVALLETVVLTQNKDFLKAAMSIINNNTYTPFNLYLSNIDFRKKNLSQTPLMVFLKNNKNHINALHLNNSTLCIKQFSELVSVCKDLKELNIPYITDKSESENEYYHDDIFYLFPKTITKLAFDYPSKTLTNIPSIQALHVHNLDCSDESKLKSILHASLKELFIINPQNVSNENITYILIQLPNITSFGLKCTQQSFIDKDKPVPIKWIKHIPEKVQNLNIQYSESKCWTLKSWDFLKLIGKHNKQIKRLTFFNGNFTTDKSLLTLPKNIQYLTLYLQIHATKKYKVVFYAQSSNRSKKTSTSYLCNITPNGIKTMAKKFHALRKITLILLTDGKDITIKKDIANIKKAFPGKIVAITVLS